MHIGAEAYLEELDRWWVDNRERSIVVEGASGSGKSTLISNWLRRLERSDSSILVFEHYLGQNTPVADMVPVLGEYGRAHRATTIASKVNAAQLVCQHWEGAADPRSIGDALSE